MTEQTTNFDLQQYLLEQKKTVEAHLDDFLPSATTYPEIIHKAMRYSVFAGGKRIRPVLALATSEAVGGDFERSIFLACALEMIHTYSLIHDDLPAMDNDSFRRGQPACHTRFGEGIAILAGNGLLTQAFHLLTRIPGGQGISALKIGVIQHLTRAIGTQKGVLAGQVVDLETQGRQFSQEELEYIHSSKTGALIEASVTCASILNDAPKEVRHTLETFGSNIGLVFQIIDDLLDIEGSVEELGKTSGKDLKAKKATYPALYGRERSREIVDDLLERAETSLAPLGTKGFVLKEIARFMSSRRF